MPQLLPGGLYITIEYLPLQLLQEYTPEDVSTTVANLPENKPKNRYPDALPCKSFVTVNGL